MDVVVLAFLHVVLTFPVSNALNLVYSGSAIGCGKLFFVGILQDDWRLVVEDYGKEKRILAVDFRTFETTKKENSHDAK